MSGSFDRPQPPECDCCNWTTTELTKCDAYARTQGHGPFTPDEDKEWAWLCFVCRSTKTGSTYLYPRNYDTNMALILQDQAWTTNYLASLMEDR